MNNIITLSDTVNNIFCKEVIEKAQNKLNEKNVVDCAYAIKDAVDKGNKLKTIEELSASFLLAMDLLNKENNINDSK